MLRVADHYSASDTGRQRRHNEDSLFARAPLFVVADGMGGARAGEVASRTAVEAFAHGLRDGAGSPGERLAERVREANARIHELSQRNADQAGMGTTITAAWVDADEVVIAHVGDSRAYCLRDGELMRLTDDHSLVDELLRQGKLTPQEAEDHPQRSIITRALGPEPEVEVDVRVHRARAGDSYLLCSDGLTTMVAESRLLEILSSQPALRDAGESLLAAANQAGGRDNITVVLLRLEDVDDDAPPVEQPTMVGAFSGAELRERLAEPHDPGPGPDARSTQTSADASPPGARTVTGDLTTSHRRPRVAPAPARAARRRRRLLPRAGPVLGLCVLLGVLFAGYIASQSVYFVGTNGRGFVTMFRGVPYVLPGNVPLYTADFVSGVSASTVAANRRHTLLDHSLRSHDDATSLMRSLELGRLSSAP